MPLRRVAGFFTGFSSTREAMMVSPATDGRAVSAVAIAAAGAGSTTAATGAASFEGSPSIEMMSAVSTAFTS